MSSISTTSSQTVPNLDEGDAAHHPTITQSPYPIDPNSGIVKSYSIIPTPTWARTSHFTIADPSTSHAIYNVKIHRAAYGFGSTQLTLLPPGDNNLVLAACRIHGLSMTNKFLFLGPGEPECTDPAEWIPVRASGRWDPAKFFFAYAGEEYAWTRTRSSELGVKSAWAGKSFKLVRVGSGEVLAVFVHLPQWTRKDEARLDFFAAGEGMGRELEVLALVAVMGIEEEIRRKE